MKDLAQGIAGALLYSLFVGGLFVGGIALGMGAGRLAVQKDAVEHGAARWTIDPTTGERSFEWNQQSKE